MSTVSTNPIDAAAYMASEFKNSVAAIRAVSAVAGRVMASQDVKPEEVIAAWLYKRMDACRTADDQKAVLNDTLEKFGPQVAAIVNSLHVPPSAESKQLEESFIKSSTSAKRIRVCETIVALADMYRELSAGSPNRLKEAQFLLAFSQFVYNNSTNQVPLPLLNELRQLIIATTGVWNAVSSTLEVFETKVNPPDMIQVKIVAVCNELGTVATVTLKDDATTTDARRIIDEAKGKIGGTLHSECVIYATVPAPKQAKVTGVPLPEPQVAPAS